MEHYFVLQHPSLANPVIIAPTLSPLVQQNQTTTADAQQASIIQQVQTLLSQMPVQQTTTSTAQPVTTIVQQPMVQNQTSLMQQQSTSTVEQMSTSIVQASTSSVVSNTCKTIGTQRTDNQFKLTGRCSIVQKIKALRTITAKDRIRFKEMGRPKVILNIESEHGAKDKEGKPYKRYFQFNWYNKYPWLCGCEVTNRMYCFPCLLFQGPALSEGINSLVHLSNIASKHVSSRQHIQASVRYTLIPTSNTQIVSTSLMSTQEKLEYIRRNRLVISHIIDFIKFYCTLDLYYLFRNDNLTTEEVMKAILRFNPNIESVFFVNEVMPKIFHNNILQCFNNIALCMQRVLQEYIFSKLRDAKHYSLIVEETSQYTDDCYFATYFRFLDHDLNPKEVLFGVDKLENKSANSLSMHIKHTLRTISDDKSKCISHSYDGASLLYDKTNYVFKSVKKIEVLAPTKTTNFVEEVDPLAEPNSDTIVIKDEPVESSILIDDDDSLENAEETTIKIENSYIDPSTGLKVEEVDIIEHPVEENNTSKNLETPNVFSETTNILPKAEYISVIDLMSDKKLTYSYIRIAPCYSHDYTKIFCQILCQHYEFRLCFSKLETVFNYFCKTGPLFLSDLKEEIERSKESIKAKIDFVINNIRKLISFIPMVGWDFETLALSTSIKETLSDENFLMTIKFISSLLKIAEALNGLCELTTAIAEKEIEKVKKNMLKIFKNYKPSEQTYKKRKYNDPDIFHEDIVEDICRQLKDRCKFDFKCFEKLVSMSNKDPVNIPPTIGQIMPNVDQKSLRFELEMLHEIQEFQECKTPLELLKLFQKNNIHTALPTVYTLLQVIVTIPPTKKEQKVSVFDKLKKFLISTMGFHSERVPILAFLATEHELFDEIDDFNEVVIDILAIKTSNEDNLIYEHLRNSAQQSVGSNFNSNKGNPVRTQRN